MVSYLRIIPDYQARNMEKNRTALKWMKGGEQTEKLGKID